MTIPLARPQYAIAVKLDYPDHFVSATQTILYPNLSSETLNDILLAVVPNLWTDCFTLNNLSLNDVPISDYVLSGQRLTVKLSTPLAAGETLKIGVDYTLTLPEIIAPNPTEQRPRIFGYTSRQTNLVNWYPFVVPYMPSQGWLLHDPWYYGEHLVYDAADFDVSVSFESGTTIPIVAASGEEQTRADGSLRYLLPRGRAFALSVSTEYQVNEADAGGVSVRSYYLGPVYKTMGEAAAKDSAKAIQIFSEKYGPYPHKTLTVVQGDFADSMEFSAFYFHSKDFYGLYNGTDRSYLTFVAAHETAHQWWFEQVGNDQALEPWLDEALAVFSERVFYEATDPSAISEYWQYARIDQYQPEGFVDTSVAEAGGFQAYQNAVYLRGEQFIEALRERVGDEAFFAFLKDYAEKFNGHIATGIDFFTVLREHSAVDFSDIVQSFMQHQP
jgi:peptidase M1-like protein